MSNIEYWMTCVEHRHYVLRSRREGAGTLSISCRSAVRSIMRSAQAGLAMGRKALAAWAERRRERKLYEELAALDSRMLRDIGLYRSEIRAAVRGEYDPHAAAAERLRAAVRPVPLHPAIPTSAGGRPLEAFKRAA